MERKMESKEIREELKKRIASLSRKGRKSYFNYRNLKIIFLAFVVGAITYPLAYFISPFYLNLLSVLMLRQDTYSYFLTILILLFVFGAMAIPISIIFCLLVNKFLSPQILLKKIDNIQRERKSKEAV